jgi:hypothetical protein
MTHSKKLRIVILGIMGQLPFGGQTWLYLNWIRGFSRLGHDVYYIEDDAGWPYDPIQNTRTNDCVYAVKHISRSMEGIGLSNNWAMRHPDRPGACWGMKSDQIDELYTSCDALFNVVGATDLNEKQLQAPLRVYVQTDPVTWELRLANGDKHAKEAFDNHHYLFTYGENYGAKDCAVPLNGLTYYKTRQPVDLDLWPMAFDPNAQYFTTIGNYRQKGSDVKYQGKTYHWSKHHEWEKFIDLPSRTSQKFELAIMAEDANDREFLEKHGWKLLRPFEMSLDIFGAYPDYIRRSRGEFTVAKDQNIRMRSGWFSERDVCYLASGKPVIAQETGFSNILPTGEGLFAFRKMEDVLEALEKINSDYEGQCCAARKLAEDYFDGKKIIMNMLQDLNLA